MFRTRCWSLFTSLAACPSLLHCADGASSSSTSMAIWWPFREHAGTCIHYPYSRSYYIKPQCSSFHSFFSMHISSEKRNICCVRFLRSLLWVLVATFLLLGPTAVEFFFFNRRPRAVSDVNVMSVFKQGWKMWSKHNKLESVFSLFFNVSFLILNSLCPLACKYKTGPKEEVQHLCCYTCRWAWLKYHWSASQRSDLTPVGDNKNLQNENSFQIIS